MFNKKEKIVDTPIDVALKEKDLELFSIRANLKKAVENIIIANGVIELYPEGVDKEKAKETAKNRKMIILPLIDKYNNLKNEINDLLNKNDRNTTKDWQKCIKTGHEIVEIVYKELYKKA